MSHMCCAIACDRRVPDEKLMCPGHWFELPKADRQAVYDSLDKHGPGLVHLAEIQPIIRRQAIRQGTATDFDI